MGLTGGILDISEFGAGSVYLDQNSACKMRLPIKSPTYSTWDSGSFTSTARKEPTLPTNSMCPMPSTGYIKAEACSLVYGRAAKAHFSWHF